MKRAFQLLLVSGISLVCILFLFELYLRFYWEKNHYHEAWVIRPSAVMNHELIPDSRGESFSPEWNVQERINSIGLREREIFPKKEGTKRILLLGDSFVYGWGVSEDKTMGRVLERELQKKIPDTRIEVINAGVPSYSPILSFLQLKTHLIALQPDVVVYVFDMSDVNDEVKYASLTRFDTGGIPLAVRSAYSLNTFIDIVLSRLHAYQFALSVVSKRNSKYVEGDEQYDHWIGLRDNSLERASRGWNLVKSNLVHLKDFVEAHQAKFFLTAVPRAPQVSMKFVDPQDAARYNFPSGEYCCREMFQYLADMANSERIQFVSPLTFFEEKKEEELFYKLDGHLTARGQELMGNILEDSLIHVFQ